MTYYNLQKLSLKKRWKISLCNQGESCWCRIIEPEEKMVDDSGNEIYVAGSGEISKIYAEHIVKLHNKNLKNENR
jgi:hypothetical protein